MEITIGEFGGNAQTGYYQVVTYTPNDQTSMHRDMLIEKDAYDKEWNEDMILEYLKADNPMDPYWKPVWCSTRLRGRLTRTLLTLPSLSHRISMKNGDLLQRKSLQLLRHLHHRRSSRLL